MLIFIGLFCIVGFTYPFLVLLANRAWHNLDEKQHISPNQHSIVYVSVVVAMRNEEKNILQLLQFLLQQNYGHDNYEIVLVDDQSEDNTLALAESFKKSNPTLNIKILYNKVLENESPKKAALHIGISAAKGNLILCTDADCTGGTKWIQSVVTAYILNGYRFIAGPVMLKGQSFAEKLQQTEFASLVGSAAATIYYRKPVFCNGANMAFDAQAYKEVKGFEDTEKVISGDDVTLMLKINQRFPGTVHFLKSADAIIETNSTKSLYSFISQRKRWAGKWNRSVQQHTVWLPIFIFFYHAVSLGGLYLAFKGLITAYLMVVFFAGRLLAEGIFLKNILGFFGKDMNIKSFLIAYTGYPFYAIFFGLFSNFGSFQWKGRKFTSLQNFTA